MGKGAALGSVGPRALLVSPPARTPVFCSVPAAVPKGCVGATWIATCQPGAPDLFCSLCPKDQAGGADPSAFQQAPGTGVRPSLPRGSKAGAGAVSAAPCSAPVGKRTTRPVPQRWRWIEVALDDCTGLPPPPVTPAPCCGDASGTPMCRS